MPVISTEQLKAAANTLRAAAHTKRGLEVLRILSHGHTLELTARFLGYHDWNTAAGLLRQGRPLAFDLPGAGARAGQFLGELPQSVQDQLGQQLLACVDAAAFAGTALAAEALVRRDHEIQARPRDRQAQIRAVTGDDPVRVAAALRCLARHEAARYPLSEHLGYDRVTVMDASRERQVLPGDGPQVLGRGIDTAVQGPQATTRALQDETTLEHRRDLVVHAPSDQHLSLLRQEWRWRSSDLTITLGLGHQEDAAAVLDRYGWTGAVIYHVSSNRAEMHAELSSLRTRADHQPTSSERAAYHQLLRVHASRRDARYQAYRQQSGQRPVRGPVQTSVVSDLLKTLSPELKLDHTRLWKDGSGHLVLTSEPYDTVARLQSNAAYGPLRQAGWTVEFSESLHYPGSCVLVTLRSGRTATDLRRELKERRRQALQRQLQQEQDDFAGRS
ncbi:glyoxalase superfamily protein [Deinococcus radiopugnans]|uniref:Glyoxalase-related protein domain-containing protein n=1 Tax=Deinococcus radiopugnans ATCC 19172 TaxID=585398 RepID=A0A5C4Y8S5_9DEIO|nr:glyoxalase superfamily protein [Deinococcus radiopugnans]MBB6017467.1 hypothetical protein [Deinococcus radiopugnans ATCC 19172]TNM71993.1 hypothetical protein FHR04_06420 [Deinococcus radiopugnans ATCC 19172]